MTIRNQVIATYKRIIRTSNSWIGLKPEDIIKERDYIKQEARKLFRENKNISDSNQIGEHLKEAIARLEIALHYKIPYPRPVNLPTYILHSRKETKLQKEMIKNSRPVYLKSYVKDQT